MTVYMFCFMRTREEEYKLTNTLFNEGRDHPQGLVPYNLSDATFEVDTHSAVLMVMVMPDLRRWERGAKKYFAKFLEIISWRSADEKALRKFECMNRGQSCMRCCAIHTFRTV